MEDLMIQADAPERPAEAPDAPAAGTNGAHPADAAKAATAQAALEAKIRQVSQAMAAAYGEIVALLARSPKYRHFSLADLEWLVVPALLANQFRIVSGKVKGQAGLQVPLGVAFWAFVSPEVAAKLDAQQRDGAMFRLAPQEWKSGDVPWLLDIVAPPNVAKAMYKQLGESVFAGKQPRGYGQAR
jgi:cytolysin-activating lysine-acyltransferase